MLAGCVEIQSDATFHFGFCLQCWVQDPEAEVALVIFHRVAADLEVEVAEVSADLAEVVLVAVVQVEAGNIFL